MTDPTPSPSPDPASMTPENDEAKTLGMLCHLLGIVSLLGPLIVWLLKKDTSAYVDAQGKESLNFHITVTFALIVSWVLTFVFIGVILMPLVGLAALVFLVLATLETHNGKGYRYPFALRLVK